MTVSSLHDPAAYALWCDATWDPRAWSADDDAPREPEADDAGPLDFSGGEPSPIRFDSQAHWLQSCLKRLVAPELTVDGAPGQRTRVALKEFQKRSKLSADGVAGPATIAALEAATATWAPDHGGAAATEQYGPVAVTRLRGPELAFRVAAAERLVDLTLATRERSDHDGRHITDAFNLALHAPLPELAALRTIGLTRGEAAVLRATCPGGPASLDTTGPALVGLGLGFSARGGGLATLLATLAEDPAARPVIERLLAPCGLAVAFGPYTRLDLATGAPVEREGFELTLTSEAGAPLRGDAAWALLRSQPHRLGALALFAGDPDVARAQVLAWRDQILARTLTWPIAGLALGDLFSSELGAGAALLLARGGYLSLKTWLEDHLSTLAKSHPELDLGDRSIWANTPALAAALTDAALARLGQDQRSGLLGLSREPGSLRADPVAAPVVSATTRKTPSAACYVERRVRVPVYGTAAASSPLLVPVPAASPGPKRLHVVAARALAAMSAAAQQDLGIELKIASAWRAHRWTSRAQYEAVLVQRFGSIAEGKRWLGYDSPHETGLAIDIGVGGLWPSRSTADAQRRQPLHLWLVEHAARFGWHPYKVEPWHWECPISLAAYRSGAVAADDDGPPSELLSFGLEDDEDGALEDSDLDEAPAGP